MPRVGVGPHVVVSMKVLALNCGSSSVKFRLYDLDLRGPDATGDRVVAGGKIEGLLGEAAVSSVRVGERTEREPSRAREHGEAVREVIGRLRAVGAASPALEAVGHRVVHGGSAFTRPTLIDPGVLTAVEALDELAPLHNAPSVAGIRAALNALGPGVPMVAVFDTAFHANLPARAGSYAIPAALAARHGIRRFGFHGLSYQSVLGRYAEVAGTRPERATVIALHLGNGCSAAAIGAGRSVDTSMGFTPLEGLVMGTRAGDLDPALVGYLSRKEGVPVATVEEWLNTRSGLLGLSGLTHDMRALLERESEHAGARLAVEVFCYRARKYVGAYLAALGGAQAVLFTGAIGENAPAIRARICDGLEWCGIRLDPERNAEAVGREGVITRADAALPVLVIPCDEERVIAREAAQCVQEAKR